MDYHIVVAAGSGLRYGAAMPKQFCDLGGRPLLMTTLERLHEAAPGAEMIVVLSPDMMEPWARMCREYDFTLSHKVAPGGSTRAGSVSNALKLIDGERVGWIAVHDAARPVVTRPMMDRLLEALADGDADGAIPAVAVTDSLRIIEPGAGGSRSVDRSAFRAVQTPQVFPGTKLLEANRRLRPDSSPTDDASVMEAAGFTRLRLVEGDPTNIKVTHPGDIEIAELYLKWTR